MNDITRADLVYLVILHVALTTAVQKGVGVVAVAALLGAAVVWVQMRSRASPP